MKKLLLLPVLAIAMMLAGCANQPTAPGSALGPLAKFTLADAQNASKMAKTENTPQSLRRAQCYDWIANQIEAAAASVFVPGLLTLNEDKYAAQGTATSLGEACGGVIPLTIAF